MSRSHWSSLADWLLDSDALFVQARSAIAAKLARSGPLTLDELVVAMRLPVRTVLLCLDVLARSGAVSRADGGTVQLLDAELQQARANRPSPPSKTVETYKALASTREVPALLWGQRRLIPDSAVERASYISENMQTDRGRIIFLGDDDLVAPLVAAIAPDWEVSVIDIDAAVLSSVADVARRLGATVSTRHADLSRFEKGEYESFDIAVADPFPSGDGSFERLFWYRAGELLRRDGMLISTLAPSHKPLPYSRAALALLGELGFTLFDLRANFGRYETFNFEFTDYEHVILEQLGLRSTIAHTKSLFAARRGERMVESSSPSFDFERWTAAAAGHYLTQQAGASEQVLLARDRGPTHPTAPNSMPRKQGLDIASGLPARVAARIKTANDTASLKNILEEELALMNIDVQPQEIEELATLCVDNSLQNESSSLALALRALESWQRWRLDERT